MPDCEKPDPLGPDPSIAEYLQYLQELAEYNACMILKGNGDPYPGICADIKELNATAVTCKTKLTLVTTPPPPLPLAPATTLSGITTQMVSVATEANAQDVTSQAGQSAAYCRCEWIDNNTLPASQSGTQANLAGCS